MADIRNPGTTERSDGDSSSEFLDAVGDAVPLRRDYVEPQRRRPGPRARFRRADDAATLAESLDADPADAESASAERLSFRRSGVSDRVFRRLSRAYYRIDDEIDLHGLKLNEARKALSDFIAGGQSSNYRCVRVVHGKGRGSGPRGPVLKPSVYQWLRRWDAVLAFVSARPVDGGTGALYVLLKP